MGEEKKEETKGHEDKKKKKKREELEEQLLLQEIVFKVDMHCEACARKLARALKGFEGVEEVSADSRGSRVVVKGKKADPVKVCERLQKKSGRKVEIISPLPPPAEEQPPKKEEEPPAEEDKEEEAPTPVTVVLSIRMHCEACAHGLQRRIRKIQGVESVETDLGNSQVTVKGVVDPTKLVDDIYKKTKKQATIVVKEEEEEEKKEEEKKKGEEKRGEEADDKSKGEDEETEANKLLDMKRSELWPTRSYLEYAYTTPQFFSDDNPNACSLM